MALWVAAPADAQNFVPQGPAPAFGDGNTIQSVDAAPNGSTSGAVTAILPSQSNANNILVGSANGGIWMTTNGGVTWTPKSDFAPSLSIASLSYDSSNSSTIYAGVGLLSNGAFGSPNTLANRGGSQIGLLKSVDGGNTWSTLANTVVQPLQGKSVVDVASNGSSILAATSEPQDASSATAPGYGLYRSNGTTAFTLVNNGTGVMPTGAATSLVGQGTTTNPYYVAIANHGVFSSDDGGNSWKATGATLGANQSGRLASAPGGTVAVAIYDNRDITAGGGKMIAVQISSNGTAWSTYTVASGQLPQVNNGSQASADLSIAVDPRNPSIVYIAGDRGGIKGDENTISAFRLERQADGSLTVTPLGGSFTTDNSTIHADSRAFAFDVNGRMILSSDGGIYARSNPQTTAGSWTGLNGNLALRESYAIAYDSRSKRLLIAAQDNGIAFQTTPRGLTYSPLDGGGDGLNALINDSSFAGKSILYFTSQNLSPFNRQEVNSSGTVIRNSAIWDKVTRDAPVVNFVPGDFTEADGAKPNQLLPFASHLVLNRVDPTKIAIGTNFAYVTTDALLQSNSATPLTNRTGSTSINTLGGVTTMAYGTTDKPDALLVGGGNGGLFYTTDATTTDLGRLSQYTTAGGLAPKSVVFDSRSVARFFVADGAKLWYTTSSGAGANAFTDLTTAQLTPLGISRPTSLEFISNNGVNAAFVGGLNTTSTATSGSPIAFANVKSDGTFNGNFATFGVGLPNTIASLIVYNNKADLLAVSLYGRGVWTVYDVTSYFSSATRLQFGLADNDSAPDASLLTNGTCASPPCTRNLVKEGAGTLTITGTATYTGTTTVNGGTMVVNGTLATGAGTGLTVNSGGTLSGGGTVPTTTVNGTIAPNNPGGILTVSGNFTQTAGSTYRALVTASGLKDFVQVNGTASLAGNVNVVAATGNYGTGRTFTLLNATGGLGGSKYDSVSGNFTFLQPTLSSDTKNVFVTLTPGGFAQAAFNPNQAAVAGVLDRSVATATGDFADVIGAFAVLTPDQARSGFQAISGQNYAGFSSLNMQSTQLFMNSFALQAGGGQTTGGGGGGSRVALAEACDVACDDTGAPRWSAWGGALGGVGTIAGNSNAPGQSFNIGGFAAGIDRRFDGGFLLGVTAGYTSATQYTQTMPGQGSANTFQAGLYGGFSAGSFYLDALAGYAHSDSQMIRPISIAGLAPRTANGQTRTDQFFGQLEAGYKVALGGPWQSFVTPFARLQGSTASQAGFSETGADSLNLTVAGQTTNSLRTVFGAQAGASFDVGWRDKLALVLRLGWSHEYADTARPVNASFAGAPASPFTVAGAEAPRDGAVLGLAASTAITDSTSLYLRYDGELAGGNTSHILSGGVRIIW